MKNGRLVHRTVSPAQASILERAIANHQRAKKLMYAWEDETEKLFDAQVPRKPRPCAFNAKFGLYAFADLRQVRHAPSYIDNASPVLRARVSMNF